MELGFSVKKNNQNINREVIKKFKNISSSHVSDVTGRLYGHTSNLKPYHKEGTMVGTAVTVKTRPGDNLMIHQAMNMAEPGDVIVVDGAGDLNQALFGEIMLKRCEKLGIAGIILNGCIRDVESFEKSSFPTYAIGVNHKGPYKDGPGEVNCVVSIDGLVVSPGDIVLGDKDGVIAIPLKHSEKIYKLAKEKKESEEKKLIQLDAGDMKPVITEEELKKMGCEFIDV